MVYIGDPCVIISLIQDVAQSSCIPISTTITSGTGPQTDAWLWDKANIQFSQFVIKGWGLIVKNKLEISKKMPQQIRD